MRAKVETVRVDGLVVRLRTMAPAGRMHDDLGPTTVLMHGIGMSHRSFARSQRALARTQRTVSVDLPGFGGVPAAGRRLSIEVLADLAVRAVRDRGAGDLVVIGQSMGAQVAVEAGLRHAEVVSSVVLVGPVVEEGRRTVLQQALGLGRDSLAETPRMNTVIATDSLRSIRQYRHELGPMLRYPMRARVQALAAPVLVVRGSVDPIARRSWAQQLAHDARRGAFVELPGPHHVQERVPVAFADLVAEFRRVETLDRLR